MSKESVARCVVQRADLARELSLAVGAVETKSTMPILQHVVLEADGCLSITATDLDVCLRTTCQAEVTATGAIAVPAKRLIDYVRRLPAGPVELSWSEDNWLTTRAGRARTRIAGMAAEEYPVLPARPEGGFGLPLRTLAAMIRRTMFAITTEASSYSLNGAQLEVGENYYRMVATDGRRLAYVQVPGSAGTTAKYLVPRKVLAELLKLASTADGVGDVWICGDENHLFFTCGDRALASRRLAGSFPSCDRVLAMEREGRVMVSVADMRGAIDRARALANEYRTVRLAIAEGQVTVSGEDAETSETVETIDAEVSGSALDVCFNGDYLRDFFSAVNTDKVTILYKDAESSVECRPCDDDMDYRVFVMPVRFK